jgi:hypothetical protein
MTPSQLRAEAEEKDRAGQAALDRGEATEAAVMFHQAEIRRLAADKLEAMGKKGLVSPSPDVHTEKEPVNTNFSKDVLARRGRGVARAYAEKTDDELGLAVVAKYGSGAKYAKALRISPSAWTGYRNGRTAVPRRVDEKVRADFPGISVRWKKGVVD